MRPLAACWRCGVAACGCSRSCSAHHGRRPLAVVAAAQSHPQQSGSGALRDAPWERAGCLRHDTLALRHKMSPGPLLHRDGLCLGVQGQPTLRHHCMGELHLPVRALRPARHWGFALARSAAGNCSTAAALGSCATNSSTSSTNTTSSTSNTSSDDGACDNAFACRTNDRWSVRWSWERL